jgi:hypothetical protein
VIRFPSPHILSAAGGLSLVSLLAFSGIAGASSVPTFAYSVNGDSVKASVTGDARTGVWRVRWVAPSGDKRVDLIIQTGDVRWSGKVQASRRQGNTWTLVSSRSLDHALNGGNSVSGCNAGVCWDTAQFRLPRNGDARFAVTVRLTQSGSYRVAGAVRDASEAFLYGGWLKSATQPIAH